MNQIECPKCRHAFSVTEEIERDVANKYQRKVAELEADFKKKKESVADEVQALLQKEKAALESRLKETFAKQGSLELQDLKSQLLERDKKIEEAQKHELALRKRARELEDKEKQLELDLQRKLDAQKSTLEEDLKKRLTEEFQLKLAEKELKLEGMTKKIEELKRKAEQGSQQMQGEAFEMEIAKTLTAKFPSDTIVDVQRGKRGADILHQVVTRDGAEAGKILYEAKNTKAWGNDWIAKAKEDQRTAKAECVVLITEVLPKDVRGFGFVDGVWVTDFASCVSLAQALRIQLLELAAARNASLGKGEKLDCLYQYMTETQFRQRIEAIIEGFRMMRDSLEREKTAMQRIWAQREKCLEQVISNTSGMYGDVQGIIGASLPKIAQLELDEGALLLPVGDSKH